VVYSIRENTLQILPKGSCAVKILHLTDLHIAPWNKKRIAEVKSLFHLSPDLVISTGDLIAHKDSVGIVINALEELLSLPGLFVFGSNDYYAPSFKNPLIYLKKSTGTRKLGAKLPSWTLQKELALGGWKDLNNRRVNFVLNGVVIEARGTDDAHLDLDDYRKVEGKVSEAVDIAIGVTHAPYKRVLAAMAQDKLDLIFAGHTHGGQIRLPWVGGSKSLTTNCDLENWRSRGVTKVNDEPWLNVSAGMGMSPFAPIRFACPPEVSLITLTA
jgi:predicted MPP superfamily phosphohydrolase